MTKNWKTESFKSMAECKEQNEQGGKREMEGFALNEIEKKRKSRENKKRKKEAERQNR